MGLTNGGILLYVLLVVKVDLPDIVIRGDDDADSNDADGKPI
jgi:hypothetical protein